MNTPVKKSKWPFWVIGIQSVLIVFFLLYAIVLKQKADSLLMMAKKNELKAMDQEKVIRLGKEVEEYKKKAEALKQIAEQQKMIAEEERYLADEAKLQAQKCCGKK